MDISVVIPVADDMRILQCVESIDEDVEVIVSMNGVTEPVKAAVNSLGIRTCETNERNLGAALDEGIRSSTKDNVLMMDSDCTFGTGCIRLLYDGLAGFILSKGRIIHGRQNKIASFIADLREFKIEGPNAFKPPLAMRKSIVTSIGYYYDRDIHWVEDAEFNNRVKARGIAVNYVPEAVIYHPSLTLFGDLRSAFRYGIGKRIGVEKGIMRGVGTHFSRIPDIAREKGPSAASYSVAWNLAYSTGFFSQALFDVYRTRRA